MPEDDITKEISKRYYQQWSDLTPEQQAKSGSREEHSAQREAFGLKGVNVENDTKQRMAGDAILDMRRSEDPSIYKDQIARAKDVVYGGGIKGFDPAASGSGAYKNEDKLSVADMTGLKRSLKQGGMSGKEAMQEVLDYAAANPELVKGDKAKAKLNRFSTRVNGQSSTTEPPPENTQPPTNTAPPETEVDDGDDSYVSGFDPKELPEDAFEGDSPEATGNFINFFKNSNRESHDYYSNLAKGIGPEVMEVYGKDAEQMYEDDHAEVNKLIMNAKGNSWKNSMLMWGDITNFKPPAVWNLTYNDPADTELENDEIDFD